MRYEFIDLSEPPSAVWTNDSDLGTSHAQWVQPVGVWQAIFYKHHNAVTVNTHTYKVEPNDLAFIPSGGIGAHARVEPGLQMETLSFTTSTRGQLRGAMPHVVRGVERFWPEWIRARDRISETSLPSKALAWHLILTLSESVSALRSDPVVYEAEIWIQQHLDQSFSVPALCEHVGVSARHLLRLFRREFGVTIQEYVHRKRIQEASRMLLTTDDPIKEIAQRLGFHDLSHFNKAIRSETGSAPRAYREARGAHVMW